MLNGLVPSAGLRPPGGSTCGLALAVWIATRPCAHDLLDVIRVAPAVVAVVHADDGDAARLRLGDGDLRAAIRRDIADLVAAIDQRGHRRLAHDAHRRARLAGLLVLGDRQDARQAGEAIAAQRVVDQLVGDDRRFIGRIADALQRRLAECACLRDAEADAVGPIGIEHSASLERAGRPLLGEGARGLGEVLGQVQLRQVHLQQHLARQLLQLRSAAHGSWNARRVAGSSPPPPPMRARSPSARPSVRRVR